MVTLKMDLEIEILGANGHLKVGAAAYLMALKGSRSSKTAFQIPN